MHINKIHQEIELVQKETNHALGIDLTTKPGSSSAILN